VYVDEQSNSAYQMFMGLYQEATKYMTRLGPEGIEIGKEYFQPMLRTLRAKASEKFGGVDDGDGTKSGAKTLRYKKKSKRLKAPGSP
jgi:hypothetical protein